MEKLKISVDKIKTVKHPELAFTLDIQMSDKNGNKNSAISSIYVLFDGVEIPDPANYVKGVFLGFAENMGAVFDYEEVNQRIAEEVERYRLKQVCKAKAAQAGKSANQTAKENRIRAMFPDAKSYTFRNDLGLDIGDLPTIYLDNSPDNSTHLSVSGLTNLSPYLARQIIATIQTCTNESEL